MSIPNAASRASEAELPHLMTRKQLAQHTGLSEWTLARWAVKGGVNHGPRITRLGGAVRYRREDVLAWIEKSSA